MRPIFFILGFNFILVFFGGGCNDYQSERAKIIVQNEGKNYPLFVEEDTTSVILPLETTSESLIGAYDKVIVGDSCLCVLDKEKDKSVFIFDREGKFLAKINCIGRGPGEYISPDDVNLRKDSLLILDRSARKMLYFSLRGRFIKEVYFGVYRPIPFTVLADDVLAFYVGMPNHSEQNAEVIVTDMKGQIIKQFIGRPGLTVEQGRFYLPYYFACNRQGTFFIPVFKDKIYRIDRDTISEIFDFGFKNLMYDYRDVGEEAMLTKDRKYSYFDEFFMTDDGTFICMNNRGDEIVNICGNIFTGQLSTWQGDVRICGNFENYFISWKDRDKNDRPESDENLALLFLDGKRLLR